MALGDLKGLEEVAGPLFTEKKLQATSTQIITGTDNTLVATPKNLKDAEMIPIHVGTSAPSDTTILWLDTN